MGKFVMIRSEKGFRFNLRAVNGEIIAVSEVYTTAKACRNGIASVVRNAPAAALEDQTQEGFKKEKHPKFEMYTDKAGQFRFRLKATNGEIIAASEAYTTAAGCKNGIESVRTNSKDAVIVEGE